MKRRILSIVTTLTLCLSMLPPVVYAAEVDGTGLCPHHPEHTAECGYIAPAEGSPCNHVHDETCGYVEAVEEVPCDMDCGDADGGATDHTPECAYAPAVEGQPCSHVCDEACGYVEADPGQPCTYDCHICPVQALIDALPEADVITAETATDVQRQLSKIDTARTALTDDEQDALDTARYDAAVSALLALADMAGANEPETLAASGACGENLIWTLNDEGTTLTISGTGAMNNWEFSPSYDRDRAPWYENAKSINSLVIQDGVTTIGNYAFKDCSNLTSVTISKDVTSIGDGAFYNCVALPNITIPAGVTTIGIYVFYGCSALPNITIPENVTSIGDGAFCDCSSLPNITIPKGVTTIGKYVFSGCSALTNITIPEDVTSIGEAAFSNCTGLKSITIPEGVTSIGDKAFQNCRVLNGVKLPESLESIGSSAFASCSALTGIVIPEKAASIGGSVFSYCKELASVEIKSAITSIGNRMFEDCAKLTSITIPDTVTSIEANAFSGCKLLATADIPAGVKSIGEMAFYECELLAAANIPEGVTSIGDAVFQGCASLTSINIPDSVTSIGGSAFGGCSGLTSITIPGSVKSIGTYAFTCQNLTTIEIQSGVQSIGTGAFRFCEKVTKIIIPDTVTSLGDDVFEHCSALESVTLSANIESIGGQTFMDCSKLSGITIPERVTAIGESAFQNCVALTSIVIPQNVATIGDNAFSNCTKLKDVTIESENVTIGVGNDVLLNFPEAKDADGDGVYELETASDLYWFAQQVNTRTTPGIKAVLTRDIDLKDGTARGQRWSPIGSKANPYTGVFGGCGYSVTNLDLGSSTLDYQGLFGYIGSDGEVSNLSVYGTVKGQNHVGGVCGHNQGTLTNCHNACEVIGAVDLAADNSTGGVCGNNDGGEITNCSNTGAVSGNQWVGGVCGHNQGGKVVNCYNTAPVSGNESVGGVCGYAYTDSSGSSVRHCYNTGKVTGTKKVGGVIGAVVSATITDCYYLTDTAEAGIGEGSTEDIVADPKTVEEFASGEVAYRLQNSQLNQVWGQQLSGDTTDAFPVFTSDTAKKVSMVTFQANHAKHATKFANPSGVGELPEAPAAEGYAFYRWSQTNAADGAEFTANTPVTSDMIVYAVWQEQFGEVSGEHTVETTYGTPATLDLAACVGYTGGTTAAKGKFTYEINSGNDTLGATVSDDTLTVPDTANAGSYTLSVTATEKAPQVSLFSLNNPGTEPVTFTVTVTVNKAASSVTTAPAAIGSLAYNKAAQALVSAGTAEGGELQYSTDGTNYSTAIPTGTDVKEYTVWYKVVGDSNHNDTEPASVSVTIAKGTPTYTVPTDLTATYGQTLANVTLPTAENGVWAWSDSTQSVGDVGTHSFTATFTPNDTDNYNTATNITVTVEVSKATPTVTTWPTASAITYGQALSDSNLEGGEASVVGTFAWKTDSTKPAVSDSGNTKYSVTFTPTDTTNYNTVIGVATLVVNKATPTVTVPTANILTYTGAAQALVTAGTVTGGTMRYSLAQDSGYSAAIPEATNAGDYTVYYKAVGDENHTDTEPATVSVNISPKTLDGTVTITGTAAMNETLTAGISDSDQTVSYQWYRDEIAISGATGNTYTLVADDVGHTIKVKATGTGNYTGTVTSQPTATVTQALPKVTAWPTAAAITYGQALSESTLTGGAADVAGSFAWKDGTAKPTVANSGTTEYEVTFTPADATAYTAITEGITLTVNPAPLTIKANDQIITYGGSIVTGISKVMATGLVNGDTLTGIILTPSTKDVPGGTITPSGAEIASSQTARLRGNTDNYAITYQDGKLTIDKSQPEISFQGTYNPGKIYDGTAIPNPTSDELIITGAHFEDVVFTWTQNEKTATPQNAGTYNLTASIKATNNTESATATQSVTISAKAVTAPTIELSPNSVVYDGTAKEPAVTVTYTEGGKTFTIPNTEYTVQFSNNTNAGTAAVTITDNENGNYEVSGSTTFTIAKATVTITAPSKTIQVGETAPALSAAECTISGLAEGDELKTQPTVTYAQTPDTSKEGSVAIKASGAVVPDGGNYEDTITYVDGTLTIKVKPTAPVDPVVAVVGVSLDCNTLTLTIGESYTYTVTITPSNATDKSVTWASSNGAVASVSGGTVNAVGAGTATITVTTKNNKTATCTVIVKAKQYTISYNGNGGDGTMGSSTVTDGAAFALPGCGFAAPEGKVFDCWAIGSVSGEKVKAGENHTFTGNTTLYAIWKDAPQVTYTVTYNANGGSGTMDSGTAPDKEAFVLPGCGFTAPAGKEFDCWAIGGTNGTHIKPGGSYIFTGNMTVYAIWKNLPHNITGTVVQKDGSGSKNVPGAVVQLMQGSTVIDQQFTDDSGGFTFTGVTSGTYNVVAEKDGIIVTVLQEITSSDKTLTIVLPEGKTNSVVEIKNDTPPVIVGNLETLFDQIDEKVYTNADAEVVKAGGAVEFKLEVEKKTESDAATQIENINAIKPANQTLGLILDLKITKTVTKQDGTSSTSTINEVNSLIETLIPLPAELQGKASYTVYRDHNGTAEALPSSGSGERYVVSADKTTITIFAQKYSTYAIAWSNMTPTPGNPGTPSGPSGGSSSSGYEDSGYAVTIKKSDHGKVTSNRVNADSGNTVTLTVTPDNGYVLDTLTVTDSRGNDLKLTAKGDGKYTFTMPSRSVTIKATFAPLPPDVEQPCDGGADCPSRAFTDLDTGTWYHEAVDYVLRHGLMSGYGGGLFGPDENLSRAQLAQILYSHAGRPAVTGASPFTDVANSDWYTNAITWAAAQGIVGGYGNGLFGPNDNITREQLAVMLWRYAGSPAATNKELYFNDIDEAGDYALEALYWAVENGILNGYGDGRLNPAGLATRAQAAAMLMRYLIETQG